MSLLQNSNAISDSGYSIANSLRFQSASSQYLSRTFGVPTSYTTSTWSFWFKKTQANNGSGRFCSGGNYSTGGGSYVTQGTFNNDTFQLGVTNSNTGSLLLGFKTNQVFRDYSAWYHIVVVWDTTNATANDRLRLYVNGERVTSFSYFSAPSLNYTGDTLFKNTLSALMTMQINGGFGYGTDDGYMTEVNFVDGQALTPSSFGETNTLTGQWVAKKYTGTYGTNGFYLPFSNGTSTTTLGYDSSGNSNNWTLNNFTRSAGVSDCWMYDVPSGNGSVVGGTQPNSNYPVVNPLKGFGTNWTFSKANLNISYASNNSMMAVATMRTGSSGKYYFEVHDTVMSSTLGFIGITTEAYADANTPNIVGYYRSGGTIANLAGTLQTSGAAYSGGNVIGVAVDIDNGTCQFYKNGVAQGATPSFTFTAGTIVVPYVGADNVAGTKTFDFNFGQRSFVYTPPSGFKSLCTANLPAATIKKGNTVFDATLYTGNGTSQSIVNAGGFSPDFVWLKSRSSGAQWHILEDTVRGAGTVLFSNSTAADQSYPTSITSFNSNGFSVGSDSTGGWNVSGSTMVAWQWDAGSSTVTNTNGTISSQVRANPTAGVSVVTWTGAGSAATVGHGLGVAPKMFITKRRDTAENWNVYHASVGNTAGLSLNITNAAITNIGYWNNTSPTANTLSIGTYQMTNGATYVGYVFAEIAGFSKFGSYTGNGSADGPFVYTGFRPKFIMYKRTNSTGNWIIYDGARSPYNQPAAALYPNLANAEDVSHPSDFLSNGFKLRSTGADSNASGGAFIFAAFASNPFEQSNAV